MHVDILRKTVITSKCIKLVIYP